MEMASETHEMIRLKWSGNGSSRYDGKTQDVERRFVMAEDQEEMAAGSTVRVRWGRQGRTWSAVVVSLLDTEPESDVEDSTPEEEAKPSKKPSKKRRAAKPAKSRKKTAALLNIHRTTEGQLPSPSPSPSPPPVPVHRHKGKGKGTKSSKGKQKASKK